MEEIYVDWSGPYTYEDVVITPPPNNLKNQQAYFTLGC